LRVKTKETSGLSTEVTQTLVLSLKFTFSHLINKLDLKYVSRDISVGISARYGLDGPGIKYRGRGDIFRNPSSPALWPTQPPTQRVPGSSRGKVAAAWH
jgi:hypothetical protein